MDWWDDIKTILTVVILGIPLLSKLVKALISKPVAQETVQKPLLSDSYIEEEMPEESVEYYEEPEEEAVYVVPQPVAPAAEISHPEIVYDLSVVNSQRFGNSSKLDSSQLKVVSGSADLKKMVIYSEIMTPKYK